MDGSGTVSYPLVQVAFPRFAQQSELRYPPANKGFRENLLRNRRIQERPGDARPASVCLPRSLQGSSETLVELRRVELLTF